MKARVLLGMLFAAPVTLLTLLFYVLPFSALGWYKYHGMVGPTDKSPLGVAPLWVLVPDKAPKWLLNSWEKWAGHCVGTAIVVKFAPETSPRADLTVKHELHHVQQMHRLGFFQPILYALSSLALLAAKESGYSMNAFELAARRNAGQIIDAESYLQGYVAGMKKVQPATSKDS